MVCVWWCLNRPWSTIVKSDPFTCRFSVDLFSLRSQQCALPRVGTNCPWTMLLRVKCRSSLIAAAADLFLPRHHDGSLLCVNRSWSSRVKFFTILVPCIRSICRIVDVWVGNVDLYPYHSHQTTVVMLVLTLENGFQTDSETWTLASTLTLGVNTE